MLYLATYFASAAKLNAKIRDGISSWCGKGVLLILASSPVSQEGPRKRRCDLHRTGRESDVENTQKTGLSSTGQAAHIRWMIRRDMPDVLGIETNCFEFAWSEDDFIRCLRQRNCIGMVAECDERVAGFMIYELHKNRLHILNFAVHSDYRRRGIGNTMMRKLLGKLSQERRNRIMLEVRETNLEAQLFFKSLGFKAISVLRDFYDDATEDAYLMQFRYQPTAEELAAPHNRITRMAG
ncbi:ribosomal-protein-alanine acetyltransferase [Rhodopirellula europaea SH398]|uniref:Ribosomal-protein-alanine acetyltransferase n=5 Tax=Rhodopirellula TaxID=265488 RepID=M5SJY3_9BACT|nr:ribosomal-protein-alanine acetyltransferase [Rhodopirellula europaea SH398]